MNGSHPSERVILAFLDGELASAEAEEVRGHCATCERCERIRSDLVAVGASLRAEPAAEPLRPVWPVVRERLEGADRRIRPIFAMAAAVSVLVGVLLGLDFGSAERPAVGTRREYVWSTVGSSLMEGEGETLAGAFVSASSGEGSTGR